jgi:asparagine synthetase B (glutamine-hydrolysing)
MTMDRPDVSLFEHAPLLRIERTDRDLVVRGATSATFGHRIDRGPGSPPDGVFAAWRWDGRAVTAENDRYGMFPLFYHATEGEFAISPSLFALLRQGVPADIDWPALAVFLRIGFFIGEDTAFRAIRILPPDGKLEWRDGRLDLAGRYHFPRAQSLARTAAVDGYVTLFRAAIARRLPATDDFAVPLSGGRDSRHILLELCEQGRRPRFCITGRRYPPAPPGDERIAALLTDALALPHVVVGPPAGQIPSQLAANVRTNMTAPRRAWKLAVREYLTAHASTSYDGIGGDMLSGGASLNPRQVQLMEAGQYEAYARSVFRNLDAAIRRLVPAPQYARLSQDVAVERLVRELARHADAPNPTMSFNFWNRTRRFNATSPYGIYADVPTVFAPFLDHDLYDLLASGPADLMVDRRFHDEAIRAAYPKYADIPFEDPDDGGPRSAAAALAATRALAEFVLRNRPSTLIRFPPLVARLGVELASLSRGRCRTSCT